MKNDLVNWLIQDCGATHVRACRVTIKGKRYEGARYMQHGRNAPMIYLLGALPACYVRTSRTVFTGIDEFDWYVAAYMEKDRLSMLPEETQRYHPCGEHFMLAPWNISEAIDAHEETPRPRVPVTFEYATA